MSMALLLVAACASKSPVADGDDLGKLIDRETRPEPLADLPPGPPASNFIGQPVSFLEGRIGEAALISNEGANEFRRYDLDYCRAYAVVSPAGGTVINLTTGPLVSGDAAPTFSGCTAGL